MKLGKKLIRETPNDRRNYKTVEDFMRWWRDQDTRKKQVAEDLSIRSHSQALMVWADDGGAPG